MNKLISIVVYVYMVAMFIFYTLGNLADARWLGMFFIWDVGKDLFYLLVIYSLVKGPQQKIVKPVVIYVAVRTAATIFCVFTGISINSEPLLSTLAGMLTAIFILYAFYTYKNGRIN